MKRAQIKRLSLSFPNLCSALILCRSTTRLSANSNSIRKLWRTRSTLSTSQLLRDRQKTRGSRLWRGISRSCKMSWRHRMIGCSPQRRGRTSAKRQRDHCS
ncbi:hypothetical protein B0H14DRAFT_2828588 [Mycena olivaceomarginata]|nr:hypothetical protein B0H14DRAFT_2828588 [Mycena olivaceomarginata]